MGRLADYIEGVIGMANMALVDDKDAQTLERLGAELADAHGIADIEMRRDVAEAMFGIMRERNRADEFKIAA